MKKAFTLVELIVVIVILAILAAISYVSYTSYLKSARDSKRISDVTNLVQKVVLLNAEGKLFKDLIDKKQDNDVVINTEGKQIPQGIIKFHSIKEDGSKFKDPLDEKLDYPIAYAIGGKGEDTYTFIQMATISEVKGTTRIVGKYYKFDEGDSESLFVNDDYTNGIPDNGDTLVYEPGVDGSDNGGNDNGLTKTIADCTNVGQIIRDTGVKYKNSEETGGQKCDTDDIILCSGNGTGFQIAACNVGASIAGTHEDCVISGLNLSINNEKCDPKYVGYHFQWGNNNGFALNVIPLTSIDKVTPDINNIPSKYSSNTFIKSEPWFIGLTDSSKKDLWGSVTNTSKARKGPCGNGYHIPSSDIMGDGGELGQIIQIWSNTKIEEGYSSGFGVDPIVIPEFSNDFLLPFAGVRNTTTADIALPNYLHSKVGKYWGSDYGNHLYIAHANNPAPNILELTGEIMWSSNKVSEAASIRCIKD